MSYFDILLQIKLGKLTRHNSLGAEMPMNVQNENSII